jgi:hypothetical protein
MPGKSKAAEPAAMVSEDAIRQRAYYLWEADGRPDGKGDHYWNLAHAEATKVLGALKNNGAGKPAKGKTASAAPAAAKPTKATKGKEKEAKPVKAKAVKAEAKPAKKATPKPRAAVPAAKASKG